MQATIAKSSHPVPPPEGVEPKLDFLIRAVNGDKVIHYRGLLDRMERLERAGIALAVLLGLHFIGADAVVAGALRLLFAGLPRLLGG
jgi:hypothetical protein